MAYFIVPIIKKIKGYNVQLLDGSFSVDDVPIANISNVMVGDVKGKIKWIDLNKSELRPPKLGQIKKAQEIVFPHLEHFLEQELLKKTVYELIGLGVIDPKDEEIAKSRQFEAIKEQAKLREAKRASRKPRKPLTLEETLARQEARQEKKIAQRREAMARIDKLMNSFELISCPHCGVEMSKQNLEHHISSVHIFKAHKSFTVKITKPSIRTSSKKNQRCRICGKMLTLPGEDICFHCNLD